MSLPVFMTIDVGPDDAILGHAHESGPGWDRSAAGLADLQAVIEQVSRHVGTRVETTWFVRADRHVADIRGDTTAVFGRFGSFLAERVEAGDEVGWMPQIYSVHGSALEHAALLSVHQSLLDAGWNPRSVRMGGCFHDDQSMAILDALRIEVDSSAIPGRQKLDLGWRLDWRNTPPSAYLPSIADYRSAGSPSLRILELPLTVIPIRAPYDHAPLLRYLNPAMRPALFVEEDIAALVGHSDYLQCVVHPDELRASARGAGHPLIAYSRDACAENLCRWFDLARVAGRPPIFATTGRAPGLVPLHIEQLLPCAPSDE